MITTATPAPGGDDAQSVEQRRELLDAVLEEEATKTIAEFRSWHKRYTDDDYDEGTGQHYTYEGCDHESWPCPTIALCNAYEVLLANMREGRAELLAARPVVAAARAVLAEWDRSLPEGVGIAFYATLIDLSAALARDGGEEGRG